MILRALAAAAVTASVTLPQTIEDVWYKTSGKVFSAGGDLTITRETLEFTTVKKVVSIPLEDVYTLSFGKLKGDVDTDWAVVAVGRSGPAELIAIRDGQKLGFGGRTAEIFETLRAALEAVSAGPYRVPQGFRAFDQISRQCTLAIPEGWDPHLESIVVETDGSSWGTIVFSSVPIEAGARPRTPRARAERDPNLERVLSGEAPAFFLERRAIEKGMSCDGFTAKARQRLLEREAPEALARKGWEMAELPTASPAVVGFCNGLRLRARSRRPDGRHVLLDLYAAASGETLFLLSLRALEENYESFRPPFETALSTLKFSVAR